MTLLNLNNISKSFISNGQTYPVLDNINLTINTKEIITIMGVSGSGKTTLLNIIGGFETYSTGTVQRAKNLKINYVTQQPHFIEELNIMDNLIFSSLRVKINTTQITEYCNYFHCQHLVHKKPSQLSGGEKQRINIIRALLTKPQIIILDEPTAALDYENKVKVVTTLNQIKDKEELAIVLVTHDREILKYIPEQKPYELKNKQLIFLDNIH